MYLTHINIIWNTTKLIFYFTETYLQEYHNFVNYYDEPTFVIDIEEIFIKLFRRYITLHK